ncbi:hypothetical protein DSO57_1036140 [Entomophthora muscae]|uniref:Uncharacterized protein n=1 Tax=Entomophthora muscae TaxID=34485 RepID=A0ACC2TA05_9FUNG|nr:hypothetical protein DSO57_1036140 [Entomophthora muscae]
MNSRDLDHALLTYQNTPAVVIGRSQNPWSECNFDALQREGISLVRRKSGGGTVYHDLGNSNYFVLMPRSSFQRTTNAILVRDALVDLGIPAEVTERKDIAVDGLKVSGSAYKVSGNKAYHHGTMLLNADLRRLSKVLKPFEVEITTKGIESVRSPVTNLFNYHSGITHSLFTDSVSKRFQTTYNYPHAERIFIDEAFLAKHPVIVESANKIKSWDWTFGQTPEFTIKDMIALELFANASKQNYILEFTCKYGLFTHISIRTPSEPSDSQTNAYLDAFNQALVKHHTGMKFNKGSLVACMMVGPPDFGSSHPHMEHAWKTVVHRLGQLASF